MQQGDFIEKCAAMKVGTPGELIQRMMLNTMPFDSLEVDHDKHFDVCAPASCKYADIQSASVAQVFGAIMGIYGGFAALAQGPIFGNVVYPILCVMTGAMSMMEFVKYLPGIKSVAGDLAREVGDLVPTEIMGELTMLKQEVNQDLNEVEAFEKETRISPPGEVKVAPAVEEVS